jgi:hypothetical protein
MKVLLTIYLFLLLSALSTKANGQKIMRPEATHPLCRDLKCLQEQKGAKSLDLRKKYRNGSPPDRAALGSLRWLDLSGNRLEKLPDWVCECENLEYLSLAQNKIHALPDCLGSLHNLIHLEANRNPLASLPSALAGCTRLRVLDLWKTWITEIPWELKALDESLQVVDLRAITMTREEQMEIYKVFPSPELRLSAWCNCAPRRPKR